MRVGLGYFIECFGDFLLSLQASTSRGGTLLDSACILGTSEVSHGPTHGFANFPMLVAGRAGGRLKYPGTHLAVAGDLATRVPFTCLKALDVPLASWGQDQFVVDTPLAGILV